IVDLVPACRRDLRRPSRDHLRVPSKEPGDEGGDRGVQHGVAAGRGRAAAGKRSGAGPAGGLPRGALPLLHGAGGCAVRADRRGAVRRRAGADAGGVVAGALEPGRTSWTAVLDAVRLGPADDETEVTAAQVRDVVTRLIEAGQHKDGDPDILDVFDAGYDVTRLAYLLADLPVELLGRLRSDRVLCFPAAGRAPGRGRPARHGGEFALADPATWPDPQVATVTETTRYGTAAASAWDRLHPRLGRRAAWEH